jgi:hypothetical protein
MTSFWQKNVTQRLKKEGYKRPIEVFGKKSTKFNMNISKQNLLNLPYLAF